MVKQLHQIIIFVFKKLGIPVQPFLIAILPKVNGRLSNHNKNSFGQHFFYTASIIFLFTGIANAQIAEKKNTVTTTQQESNATDKSTAKNSVVQADKKGDGVKKAKKNKLKKTASIAPSSSEKTQIQNSGITISPEQAPLDFNQLPAEVQKQISINKASGKIIMAGVAKAFTVKIATCTNAAETKQQLAFLTSQKGITGVDFVSSGIVKITTDPDFDSVALKEIMKANKVNFIFLDKYYCLKTKQ